MLGVNSLDRAREGDCLADVLNAAHPGGDAFCTHAKAGVGDGAILAKLQVPLERFLGQAFLLDASQQFIGVAHALRAAADLAVAFGSEQIH